MEKSGNRAYFYSPSLSRVVGYKTDHEALAWPKNFTFHFPYVPIYKTQAHDYFSHYSASFSTHGHLVPRWSLDYFFLPQLHKATAFLFYLWTVGVYPMHPRVQVGLYWVSVTESSLCISHKWLLSILELYALPQFVVSLPQILSDVEKTLREGKM